MTVFATWIVILRDKAHALWRDARSSLLVALCLVLVLAAAAFLTEWRNAVAANDAIEALDEGRDIAVDANARPEALLARIAFLAARNDVDHARASVEALDRSGGDGIRARGHYLLGNALLRKAFDQIQRSELEAANPFVNLAKREYRRALQLAPDYWDAKFNLDVAARLVRDFPDFERKSGDELSADPKKLWTDIPGKPKGLP
ncbi:MAG: MxaK protein [Methylocystis sp.]|uniref:MxaK protein n=1 Tax=Methylocystis sp. TaxID=1911079 RepID=UPI003D0D01DD